MWSHRERTLTKLPVVLEIQAYLPELQFPQMFRIRPSNV